MTLEKQKQKELVCGTCGLPVASGPARTDVTRYLSDISRCNCAQREPIELVVAPDDPDKLRSASDVLPERYEVQEFLGSGGMGSVYKVRDRQIDKILAVKILNPQLVQDENSVKRFQNEGKAASQLNHAHLAAVYESSVTPSGVPFIIMDYLEGQTLQTLLSNQHHLGPGRSTDIMLQLCEAVQYAHSSGVVHRDIKPANVIISNPQPGMDFAKLFDFGIAKVMPERAIDFTQDVTQTGDLFGSPLYMSPEQCKGLPVDGRSDIHALGCVFYEMLTGVHPFAGRNFVDTVVKIVTAQPPTFAESNANDISPELEFIVMKCLAKSTEDRYQNLQQVTRDLELARDGKPIPEMNTKDHKNLDKRVIFAAAAGLALVIGIAGFMVSSTTTPTPVPRATGPTSPYEDAERLDSLSYSYFVKGDYERAIPLLEFGIKTYKEKGTRLVSGSAEQAYLAENYSHIGKCYLKLGKMEQAATNYREALRLFRDFGKRAPMMHEAITDYAEALTKLGFADRAQKMIEEFNSTGNLRSVPGTTPSK